MLSSIRRQQPEFIVVRPEYAHKLPDIGQEVNEKTAYVLYRCTLGPGNQPFFLLKNPSEKIECGERCTTLEKMTYKQACDYFKEDYYPSEYIIQRWAKELKISDQPNDLVFDFVLEKIPIAREVPSIEKAMLDEIINGDRSLTDHVEGFLSENCVKDKKLLFWARKSLLVISDEKNRDYHLAKYRGHSLIVKTPKTGFSHLAEKIGEWYSYTSQASTRGFAKGRDEIYRGIFENQFGNIILDEIKYYKEIVSDMALTPMEQGIANVSTAGTRISSKGAPAISMITNAGKEDETKIGMMKAINHALSFTTSSPEAYGSRLGMIIFGKLDMVQKGYQPPMKTDVDRLIVDEVRRLAIPTIKLIYRNDKVQEWLNQPLKNYEKIILGMIKSFDDDFSFGEMSKLFWRDHAKGAYSHIRGAALEYALVTLFRNLIELHYDMRTPTDQEINDLIEKEVIPRAEEAVNTVTAINLDSLRLMIKETSENKEVMQLIENEKFDNLKGYKKAIVLAYCKLIVDGSDPGKMVIIDELMDSFNSINSSIRLKLLGISYMTWSIVRSVFSRLSENAKKEISYSLDSMFGITLDGILIDNHIVWHISSKKDLSKICDYIRALVYPLTPDELINPTEIENNSHTPEDQTNDGE